jgi:hypothetical protein
MKKDPNVVKRLKEIVGKGIVLGCMALMAQSASAAVLKPALLAKAAPDECFNGVGEAYLPLNPNSQTYEQDVQNCINGGYQPKVNQAYVWGLANTEAYVWFGTAPNTLCLVKGTYHQQSEPTLNDSWVCELSESQYPLYLETNLPFHPDLDPMLNEIGLGDWRISKIYRYNKTTGMNEDISPMSDPNFLMTLGIRSAGTHNGVVFFAGPGFGSGGLSVNMFAFKDDANHTYLGSHSFAEYSNIRKWIVVGDDLYTAVGDQDDIGRVLKWEGNATDPFQFVEVGRLPGSGAELAYHEGRLFVTTWPGSELPGGSSVAGVYMSPIVGEGLSESNATWQEIWKASEYEPDPVVAATYGGGAIASFDGQLYWGTMHVPMVATMAAVSVYDINTSDEEAMTDTMLGTHRAISIFRASNIAADGNATVELLYGETMLPRYIPGQGFVDVPNNMGTAPLWGESGFGNTFNNYTWTMEVFKDRLYIGTMDWSYLMTEMLGDINLSAELSFLLSYEVNNGADLWRIDGSTKKAVAENTTGIGNYGSYGIRTMVSDADHFYLGMANPMNLMTDVTDNKPEGGWELIQMDEKVSTGGGGGCTYNPNADKFDMMFFVLLALSALYPWRRKLIR